MVNQLNIILEFTVGGATYNNAIMYNMRIKDTTMNRYELYAGIDANPNLDGAASTTSATLPFTYALSTPVSGTREHRITVRKRNSLGLTSLNNFYRSFIVDNTGALVGSEISAPQDISVENVGDKSLRIRASYSAALDDDPADTFIIYATDDGVDPDPTVDTPITIGTVGDADIITGKSYISFVLDSATYGLEWNTTIKVIVRMLRSGDSVESDNLDIVTTVIDSGEPAVIANGQDVLISTTTHNASPACVTYSLYGQTYTLLSSTLLWRAIVGDKESGRLFINNALALANATISGSGTGDIEVVDANTLYLNVGGTRRAKVDLSANTISAATIVYNGVIDDNVSVGPLSTDNGKLYLSVYNPSRQLWQPFLQLDSSGVLTFGFPIIQKDT
jgi:hypothetical protein